MQQRFEDTEACRSRNFCATCRDLMGGRAFRQKVRQAHGVPGNHVDWECPHGLPWQTPAGEGVTIKHGRKQKQIRLTKGPCAKRTHAFCYMADSTDTFYGSSREECKRLWRCHHPDLPRDWASQVMPGGLMLAADCERECPVRCKDLTASLVIPCAGDPPLVQSDGRGAETVVAASGLTATVESALEDPGVTEIIVVDDQMATPYEYIDPRVRVVRTERQLGVGASRNFGAESSTGAVVMWTDAHCLFPDEALSKLARLAYVHRGLICTSTLSYSGHSSIGSGAMLTVPNVLCGDKMRFQKRLRGKGVQPVRAIMGSVYALWRPIWAAQGPWLDTWRHWGYSEEAYCLLARFLGVPVLCATDLAIRHYFFNGRTKGYDCGGKPFNAARSLYCLFGDEIWRGKIRPALLRFVKEDRMRQIEEDPATLARREEIAGKKIVSDQEVWEWIGGTSCDLKPRKGRSKPVLDRGESTMKNQPVEKPTSDVTAFLLFWKRPDAAKKVVERVQSFGVDEIWAWGNEGAQIPEGVDVPIQSGKNHGPTIRWLMAQQVSSKWVYVQDDDCLVTREAFDAMLQYARAHPDDMVGIAGELMTRTDAKGRDLKIHGQQFTQPVPCDSLLTGWGALIPVDLMRAIYQGFREYDAIAPIQGDDRALSMGLWQFGKRRPIVVNLKQKGFANLPESGGAMALARTPGHREARNAVMEAARQRGWTPVAAVNAARRPFQDLTAIVCTWRRPKQAQQVIDHLRGLGLGHIMVWADENADVPGGTDIAIRCNTQLGPYSRLALGLLAPTWRVLWCDDDVLVSAEGIEALERATMSDDLHFHVLVGKLGADHHTDPRRIVYSDGVTEPTEIDVALPGWGAMCSKATLHRILGAIPGAVAYDNLETFRLVDNRVISVAVPRATGKHPLVVPTRQRAFQPLPGTNSPDAMCKQEDVKQWHAEIMRLAGKQGWEPVPDRQAAVVAALPLAADEREAVPPVTLLTPTYGRFELLCRVAGCVLGQDYPGEITWLIVNDASVPILCDVPNVIVMNVGPGAFGTVGDKRRYLLEQAKTEIVGWIDDDDLYAPEYVRVAVEALLTSGAECVQNKRAWRVAVRQDGQIASVETINSNNEGNMLFRRDAGLRHGIPGMDSGQLVPMLQAFKAAGRLHKYGSEGNWTYAYCWTQTGRHLSAQKTKTKAQFEQINRDFGDSGDGVHLIPDSSVYDARGIWACIVEFGRSNKEVQAATGAVTHEAVEPAAMPAARRPSARTAALIPCFNDEQTIVPAVRAIAPHVDEVVVYDDCSTDRSPELLEGLERGQDVPNLRVVRGEGRQANWCGARNQLLELTAARKLLFIDADDIFYEDQANELERLLAGPEPHVQLGLLELWGDYHCGTGRGVRHPHHDPCHVYIDRSAVPELIWRMDDTFTRVRTGAKKPVRYARVLFAHAKGVKSDLRLLHRERFRDWIRGGAEQFRDYYDGVTQPLTAGAIHRDALRVLFGSRGNPIRRLPEGMTAPAICLEHEHFRVIWQGDEPVDRVEI